MPDEPHNSSWLWSSYFSDINEIKDFLNKSVTDSYRFGDFVKEAFLEAKIEKLYGADIYGKIQAEIIRAEKMVLNHCLPVKTIRQLLTLLKNIDSQKKKCM